MRPCCLLMLLLYVGTWVVSGPVFSVGSSFRTLRAFPLFASTGKPGSAVSSERKPA
jgi:hypothetical protein